MRNSTRPSDEFAEAADKWVTLDGAARMYEQTKSIVFAQRCRAFGDIPVNRAEQQVHASDEWADFVKKMVQSRTDANRAKVRLEYLRMKHMEANSDAANERVMSRMSA